MNRLIVTINKFLCDSIPWCLTMVLLVAPSSLSRADQSAIPSGFEIQARDGITFDSVNLTAKRFFKSYMSDSADERKSAELYLLGVLDATEGKSWCDYRTFKIITLHEEIFTGFKKLNSRQLDERASKVIEDILKDALSEFNPCRRAK